jgi:hypothetical protein
MNWRTGFNVHDLILVLGFVWLSTRLFWLEVVILGIQGVLCELHGSEQKFRGWKELMETVDRSQLQIRAAYGIVVIGSIALYWWG